jgi:hypothetical protein
MNEIFGKDKAPIIGKRQLTFKTNQIIEEDIIKTNEVIDMSNTELIKADKIQIENTSTKLTVATVGTTIVGAVAMSVAGIKIGLILGTVALFSGTVWSIWPEKIIK